MMDKMNCGVIYAVKMNVKGNYYESIASFMSKYTNTPVEYYTNAILETILSNAIADLLNNLIHPSAFWFEYWRLKQYPWEMNDFEAICAAMANIQVRDTNNYINGFQPIEEFNL